jgi:hypothetical protein
MTVSRIWARHGLQPHRLRRSMLSEDPDFQKKAADIIGSILTLLIMPPSFADEKLSKPWTVWILFCPSPGRAEAHCFGYYRHGTLSLYAALDTQSGEILGKTLNAIPAPSLSTFLLT